MPSSRTSRLAKASWLAFGIIALAALACAAQEHNTEETGIAQGTGLQLILDDGGVAAQNDQSLEGMSAALTLMHK
jgi:hypothetical protein